MMQNIWYGQTFGLSPLAVIGLGFLAGILAVIIIALKGYSLWTAAHRGEKWWFFFLLILNTAGILELIYLFFVAKKWRHNK